MTRQSERDSERRFWLLAPLAAGIIAVLLAIHAARIETPTVDEFAHVPAGCAYLAFGRFDVYSKNPPLAKELMAAPVLLSGAKVPDPRGVPPDGWQPWRYGVMFERANTDRYFDLFFRARLVTIVFLTLAAVLVFFWSRDLFGMPAAALTTSLFLLCPNLLAHGHLGTVDVACMTTILLTVFTLRWAYRKEPRWWKVVLVGGAWGVALLTKFTAVLLLPALVILTCWLNWPRPEPRPSGSGWASPTFGSARRAPQDGNRFLTGAALSRMMRDVAIQIFVAIVVINIVMGFADSFRALGGITFGSAFMQGLQSALPAWLPVPLPADYVIGFDAQKRDTEQGEFGAYLFGEWSGDRWWYYNIIAFLVKMPLATQILMLAGIACLWKLRPARRELLVWLLPPITIAIFLFAFNRLNIGIRYLLPIFPFLFMLTGALWLELPRKLMMSAAAVTFAWIVISILLWHPRYLSYFNELALARGGGERILLDSNIDWGQDLYRLPDALAEMQLDEPVHLLYFGHVDPHLYGIEYQLCPNYKVEGVIAVSVNFLMGAEYAAPVPDAPGTFTWVRRGHVDWLSDHQPVRKLGSIWLFNTREH